MTTDGLSKRAQRFERSEGHRAHSTKRDDSKELQRLQMKMQKLCREQEHSHSSRSTFLLISHTCYFLDSDINELFMLMNHFSNAANPGLTLRLKLFPIMLFFSRLAAANRLPSSNPVLFLFFSHTNWPHDLVHIIHKSPLWASCVWVQAVHLSMDTFTVLHKFKPPQCATYSLSPVVSSVFPFLYHLLCGVTAV